MGATLGPALHSPVAVSVTRPASSPWKATFWPCGSQQSRGRLGCQPASPAATVKGALAAETTTAITHGLWRQEQGPGQVCAAHLGVKWGQEGG